MRGSIGSHVLADAALSGWPVFLFWPFSGTAYQFAHSVPLAHPINIQLFYVGYIVVLALMVIGKRTPLEPFSPRLGRLFVSVFLRKHLACHQCSRGANLVCAVCGKPVCLKHAFVQRSAEVYCQACDQEKNYSPTA